MKELNVNADKSNLLKLKIPRTHHKPPPLKTAAICFWGKRPVAKIVVNAVTALVLIFWFIKSWKKALHCLVCRLKFFKHLFVFLRKGNRIYFIVITLQCNPFL